jgi:hypothetical protein
MYKFFMEADGDPVNVTPDPQVSVEGEDTAVQMQQPKQPIQTTTGWNRLAGEIKKRLDQEKKVLIMVNEYDPVTMTDENGKSIESPVSSSKQLDGLKPSLTLENIQLQSMDDEKIEIITANKTGSVVIKKVQFAGFTTDDTKNIFVQLKNNKTYVLIFK